MRKEMEEDVLYFFPIWGICKDITVRQYNNTDTYFMERSHAP